VWSEALAQRTAAATSLLAKGALWQPEEAIDELGQMMRPPRWMMDCGLFTCGVHWCSCCGCACDVIAVVVCCCVLLLRAVAGSNGEHAE